MIRTHKIALDPTPKQARQLARHAGYARVAYNHALADFKDGLDQGEWRTHYELRPRWNQVKQGRYPWCRDLSQNAAKYAIMALGDAVKAWRNDKQKNRFPRFKSRRGKAAFRADNGPGTVCCQGRRIRLPKIGSLRMREASRFHGGVLECTVKRDAGRWFACVCMEDGAEAPVPKDGLVVGVDMGVKTLATCSDGMVYANPRAEATQRRKVRRYNKALARSLRIHGRHKGSNRRRRTRHKLAAAHYKAACLRSDAQHKASTEIVRRAACVVVEDLNVRGMVKNGRLARAVSDAGMSGFVGKLSYKCEAAGVRLVQADRWFPSTKLCSGCGQVQAMPLNVRTYSCDCGMALDRDLNAARNLERYAAGSSSEAQNGRGGRVRPSSDGSGWRSVNGSTGLNRLGQIVEIGSDFGERLSNAERKSRFRERRKEQQPRIHYRRPQDRRSRPQRWRDAGRGNHWNGNFAKRRRR